MIVFLKKNTREYKVTLLVYSGLPDPVWWIHPRHEKFKEMKEFFEDARVRGIVHRHEHAPAISDTGVSFYITRKPSIHI